MSTNRGRLANYLSTGVGTARYEPPFSGLIYARGIDTGRFHFALRIHKDSFAQESHHVWVISIVEVLHIFVVRVDKTPTHVGCSRGNIKSGGDSVMLRNERLACC